MRKAIFAAVVAAFGATGAAAQDAPALAEVGLQTRIDVLAQDKSTSVRLAIINSLSDLTAFDSSEQRLFTLATQEDNLLVQIELCRLLLNYGSADIKNLLAEQASQQKFKPEVRALIQAQLLASHI